MLIRRNFVAARNRLAGLSGNARGAEAELNSLRAVCGFSLAGLTVSLFGLGASLANGAALSGTGALLLGLKIAVPLACAAVLIGGGTDR
jgi:hypothetical protein